MHSTPQWFNVDGFSKIEFTPNFYFIKHHSPPTQWSLYLMRTLLSDIYLPYN